LVVDSVVNGRQCFSVRISDVVFRSECVCFCVGLGWLFPILLFADIRSGYYLEKEWGNGSSRALLFVIGGYRVRFLMASCALSLQRSRAGHIVSRTWRPLAVRHLSFLDVQTVAEGSPWACHRGHFFLTFRTS